MGDLRNDEENQAVVEDEAHNARSVPPRRVRNAELVGGEHQDGQVEAHGVDERRSQHCVVGVGDDASLAGDPCRRQENAYRALLAPAMRMSRQRTYRAAIATSDPE